jgi:hypothetical protein
VRTYAARVTVLGESIKPVLHRLCVTFVDYILEKEFYPTMNQLLIEGLSNKLSPPSLMAAMGVRYEYSFLKLALGNPLRICAARVTELCVCLWQLLAMRFSMID